MPEYIEREAFIADKKWLYCTDCEKRKGKKRGKMVTLYEIGEAPCKSCGIHDMLEEVEMYPAADVRPVVRAHWKPGDIRNVTAVCSNCGRLRLGNGAEWATKLAYFCEKCGADMRPEPPKEE